MEESKKNLKPDSNSKRERIEKQKESVLRVAKSMVERGLIIRNWGNVSRRSGKNHFVCTPENMLAFELSLEDISRVNINTLSYSGDSKPSEEKNMHAAIYKVRDDAGFIIHTHQPYAAIVSALEDKEILISHGENEIPEMEGLSGLSIIPYEEVGSEELEQQIVKTLNDDPDSFALLLASHGMVCWGRTEKEAMHRAEQVEIVCYTYLAEICNTNLQYGLKGEYSSERDGDEIRYLSADVPEKVQNIHKEIYKKRSDINAIVHQNTDAERIVANRFTRLEAIHDDFAQIIGAEVKIPANSKESIWNSISIRKSCNAIFSPEYGAFCLGRTIDHARAAAMIVNKECIAKIALTRIKKDGSLPWFHRIKMHRTYVKKSL